VCGRSGRKGGVEQAPQRGGRNGGGGGRGHRPARAAAAAASPGPGTQMLERMRRSGRTVSPSLERMLKQLDEQQSNGAGEARHSKRAQQGMRRDLFGMQNRHNNLKTKKIVKFTFGKREQQKRKQAHC
jgi:hypothetical protein